MRLLLVDNYDSFTFNLFHLAARVTGREPLVIRNDQFSAGGVARLDCDAIIIAPGPGRPDVASDMGVGAELLRSVALPTLGVCLGHQGIAHTFGARVTHAPEPMHGRIAQITHRNTDLFEAIPQGFSVVRYHSLIVEEPLPASLEATAWTHDGLLMGLRHRDAPIWGVQFHPESICTEYGERLLGNFVAMARAARGDTREWSAASRRSISVVPPPHEHERATPAHRLLVREAGGAIDSERAFDALFADVANAVWLDSSRVEEGLSRFSFLGAPIGPLGQKVSYRADRKELSVTRGGVTTRRVGSVLPYIEEQLREHQVSCQGLPFDFHCGFAGYLGYELKSETGGDVAHASPNPDAVLVLVDRLVAFDHQSGRTYLVALVDGDLETQRDAERWLDSAEGTLATLDGAAPRSSPVLTECRVPALRWSRDRARYHADLRACLREIRDGETYEVCLTNTLHVDTDVDPLSFYKTLRRCNPAPYAAFLAFDDVTVACSSPERFLKVDASGAVETKPIKGTARRGTSAIEDAAIAARLAECEKARSENLMITDLLRNDLALVCEVGSVHVPGLMQVETYATVHQLVSTIRGRVRKGISPTSCVQATFPGGSMTGAPKVRTMHIIDSLETEARGVYSGAIGYFSLDGSVDLNIVIRTAVFDPRGMHIGVGGAVVALSDVDEEYEETVLKARALVRALLVTSGVEDADAALERLEAQLRESVDRLGTPVSA
jgi:para-aminobenzoate synthetase